MVFLGLSNKMPFCRFLPFHPESILWKGLAVLGGSLAVIAPLVWFSPQQSPVIQDVAAKKGLLPLNREVLSFSFGVEEPAIALSWPHIEAELAFSLDPPRPGREAGPSEIDNSADGVRRRRSQSGRTYEQGINIWCKQSAQSKRISLPCSIGLRYLEEGRLGFSDGESSFWVDLIPAAGGQIQAIVWIETPFKEKLETERFITNLQESPILEPKEFAEGSPFRVLAEGRWLGPDVFFEKYGGGRLTQRIGIEAPQKGEIVEIQEEDWLVWSEGRWIRGVPLEGQKSPIARLASADSRVLILEGWGLDNYVRLSLPLTPAPLSKIRAEEIFTSIRIRSERQISCMMDKQCLILRCGDWILKTDGKWKILRKIEEKEAYKSGKILGELFVFEKIDSKQGQKFIQGFLFNPEKTQAIPVEMAANKHPVRKSKERIK